jgi:hypothetical protein
MDPLKFVVLEQRENEDRAFYAVKPSEIYPAMIEHIKETLVAGKAPAKFLDTEGTPNPLCMYHDEAKRLPAKALDLALVPYAEALGTAEKSERNAALECARKWFTELLHQALRGAPIGLHILSEDRTFKLC